MAYRDWLAYLSDRLGSDTAQAQTGCAWPTAIRLHAREIGGNLSCTSMHFQALSCNGRLPELFRISYLRSNQGTHKAGVEGSIPSLSTI